MDLLKLASNSSTSTSVNLDDIFNRNSTNIKHDLISESGVGQVCKTVGFEIVEVDDNHDDEDLIYPSILDGLDLVEDQDWVDILYDAAYGKMPPGFIVRNDGISYSSGGKRQSMQPSADPEDAVNETIQFFRTAGGIRTSLDLELEQEALMEARTKQDEEYRSLSWSKLKGGGRSEAISYFANRVAEKMKLSSRQKSILETIIHVGLNTGAIKDRDIIFAKGEILEILPISFDGRTFHLDSEAKKRAKLPSIKDTCPDDVYFDRYAKLPDPPSRKYSGFNSEWQKLNRNVAKTVIFKKTTRSTYGTTHTSSGRVITPRHRDNSISVSEWIPEVIDQMKPTEFAFNPDDPLLSPRPLTYSEMMHLNSVPGSVRTNRPISSRRYSNRG